MKLALSCSLVLLAVVFDGLHASGTCSGSCQFVPGPPGRDGRDGVPGQPGKDGKDGKDGCAGGSLSYREFYELRESLIHSLNLEEHARNLTEHIKRELFYALRSELLRELRESCGCSPTPPPTTPPGNMSVYSSCDEIFNLDHSAPSGNYYIRYNNSAVEVYCHMERGQGTNNGGWMRVSYINASHPGPHTACPPSTAEYDVGGKKLCGPAQDSSCSSVVIPTYDVPYSSVVGVATGHAFGFPCAFSYNTRPLRDGYFSGLSFTQGPLNSDDSHIWTYAIGFSDVQSTPCNCPCSQQRGHPPPSYVGDHYYCDTITFGTNQNWDTQNVLWDGYGCYHGNSSYCCDNARQPVFTRHLNTTTTNDITIRWCTPHALSYSNFGTDKVELYVR